MRRSIIASALWLIALFLHRVEMSGAVPADEFVPAYYGYMLITPLRVVALFMFLSQVFVRDPKETDRPTLIGFANLLIVAGVFSEYIALCGVLIFLFIATKSKGDDAEVRWPSLSIRGTVKDVWRSWLPLLSVTLFLGLGELYFFTSRFFDAGIVNSDIETPYLLSLAGFATLSALKGLMIVLRVVVPGLAFFYFLKRVAPKKPCFFDISIGLILGANLFHLFWQTMRDELLGLEKMYAPQGSVLVLFAALIVIGSLLLRKIFESQRKRCRDGQGLGFVEFLIVPFSQAKKLTRALQSVTLIALLIGFRFLLYPTVEDYRAKLFDTFAQMAIVVGVLLLIPLGQKIPRKVISGMAIILTILGLYSSSSFMQRPDVRLVAFEYSRFCALGASAPWAKWVETRSAVGFDVPAPLDPFPEARADVVSMAGKSRPPIFLIIWDAARPDHLSAYDYHRDTTPHLSALAKDGVVFTEARSTATATTLGIRNMMTGCYSTRFMLSKKHRPFFVKDLTNAGYEDHFITVTGNDYNGVSAEAFGRSWTKEESVRFHVRNYSNTDELKPDRPKSKDLIEFIRESAKQKTSKKLAGFFHYVHLTGTHSPWLARDEVRHFGDSAIDLYDGEVAKVDHLLGELVAELKKHDLYEESIIVVTADHGTGLGEHGRLGGFLPYEEQLRIPLLVKGPFPGRGKSNRFVGNIDIAPTLLELIGAPTDSMDGVSFADTLLQKERELPKRAFVAFCAFRDGYAVYHPEGRYKLHHYRANGYEALFDLQKDPKETHNLILEEPEIAQDLRTHLDHFLWRGKDRYGNPYHYRAWDLDVERKRQK
ncbi:MAG: arylsulfatase A-like enzyme [Planctomycetota bacterium]|jgi:arylsulfatase A-like enzyme